MAKPPRTVLHSDQSLFVLIVFLGLLLTVHFLFIIGFNLPTSPLTTPFRPMLVRYAIPYFQQRWTFFAPKPPTQTVTVVARAKAWNDATKQNVETAWVDVSGPLVEQEKNSRMAPLALVQLGLSNATLQFVNDVGELARKDTSRDFSNSVEHPIAPDIDPLDFMAMNRTAEASLTIQFPDLKIDKLQVGVAVHDLPTFEDRFKPDDPQNVVFLALKWQDAQHIAPFCCAKN